MGVETEFIELNKKLRKNLDSIDRKFFRKALEEFGVFYKAKNLSEEELASYLPGGIAAVDGSINSYGGLSPNILYFLNACYLPDTNREKMMKTKLISPILAPDDSPNLSLSKLEVLAATEGLKKFHSKVILMDGGFIRFIADAEDEFAHLVKTAKEKKILLMGVIEDMKSRSIAEALKVSYFDREIFFGLLHPGEAFFLDRKFNNKKMSDIGTFYFRPGNNPQAIAIDYPQELEKRKFEACDIVKTFTPENSRGIPFILDMVDKFARVSDRDIEKYVKQYIDEDVRRIYLDEARNLRWL